MFDYDLWQSFLLLQAVFSQIIALEFVAVLACLITMYAGNKEAFGTQNFGIDKEKNEDNRAGPRIHTSWGFVHCFMVPYW